MIIRNGKEIVARFKNNKQVVAIYKGAHIIWEFISSCFGKGFWIEDAPWSEDSAWSES